MELFIILVGIAAIYIYNRTSKELENLSYEAYHAGVRCPVTSLVKNRIHKINCCLQVIEVLRYLNSLEKDTKKTVLLLSKLNVWVTWTQAIYTNKNIPQK